MRDKEGGRGERKEEREGGRERMREERLRLSPWINQYPEVVTLVF